MSLIKLALSEYAPGLPSKGKISDVPSIQKNRPTQFSIQRHEAERAGPHYDFRLKINNIAYSWAIPSRWPTRFNDRVLAVRQPDHTVRYMNWSGVIEDGYGKGKVSVFRSGDAEIIEAGPRKIKFVLYDRDPEEYVMVKTSGKNWILFRRKIEGPPTKKPKFKSYSPTKGDVTPDKIFDVLSAKLDGAHAAVVFGKPGEQVRVFSPRISKRTGRPIEYTYKIPDVIGVKTPKELSNTVVRGEVLAVKGRKSMGHTATARILNTRNPIEARKKQREYGKLKLFPFSADIHRGKEVPPDPREVLPILNKVKKHTGWPTPEIEFHPKRKERLYKRIESGEHPMTDEGVIGYIFGEGKPYKVKFRPDADVWVRRIFPSKRKGYAGGFEYSYTWNSPVVGRVGTGFDHKTLKDMYENPKKYIGRKATIEYQSGGRKALRAPSFKRWHLDY